MKGNQKNPQFRTYAETIKAAEHKKASGGYHTQCQASKNEGIVRRKIEEMEEAKREKGEYLL